MQPIPAKVPYPMINQRRREAWHGKGRRVGAARRAANADSPLSAGDRSRRPRTEAGRGCRPGECLTRLQLYGAGSPDRSVRVALTGLLVDGLKPLSRSGSGELRTVAARIPRRSGVQGFPAPPMLGSYLRPILGPGRRKSGRSERGCTRRPLTTPDRPTPRTQEMRRT